VRSGIHRQLILTALFTVLLTTIVAALVVKFLDPANSNQSELYDPGREALVEAEWRLAQAVPHGATGKMANYLTPQQVAEVLDKLDTARHADSAQRQRIDALRRMVTELEEADRAARASLERRTQLYERIVGEMDSLIEEYSGSGEAKPAASSD
ncbi:MAG: hypothetical protein KDJ24_07395, partial [Gammaproteobacteria bacterium]|nr:hypothetical protein [Gammaproteobacteria bacterium]